MIQTGRSWVEVEVHSLRLKVVSTAFYIHGCRPFISLPDFGGGGGKEVFGITETHQQCSVT